MFVRVNYSIWNALRLTPVNHFNKNANNYMKCQISAYFSMHLLSVYIKCIYWLCNVYLESMEYVFFIIPELILDFSVVSETCCIILCMLNIPSKCAYEKWVTGPPSLFGFKLQ